MNNQTYYRAIAILVMVFITVIYVLIFVKGPERTLKTSVEAKPVTVTTNTTETKELPEPDQEPEETSEKASFEFVMHYDVPLEMDLQDHILEVCEKYGIEPGLVIAIIQQESNFDASAIGDYGESYGLMQVQPRWFSERAEALGCTDFLDPYQNITIGVDILAELLEKSDSLEWALMAYNGGPDYANEMRDKGWISYYVRDVIANSKTFETYPVRVIPTEEKENA